MSVSDDKRMVPDSLHRSGQRLTRATETQALLKPSAPRVSLASSRWKTLSLIIFNIEFQISNAHRK